jgi:MoxR-like ATPase
VLADEINRATPRTQSALLECMEERQVTVDGVTDTLASPFIVIATQNPIETAGTYQLPEAQLDRFIMKINMGYPKKSEEIDILNRFLKDSPLETINSVCTKEDIIAMQKEAKNVFVHQAIMSYIVDIVNATRSNPSVSIGVSPRGTITMINAARAFAYISGRGYVTPEDIKTLAKYVFAHRLVLRNGFADKDGKEKLIEQIISSVEVPTEEWDR